MTAVIDEKMSFHLKGNGGNYAGAEWIAAEGIIVPESADRLESFVRSLGHSENPGGWAVRLNSPGGDLAGGLLLGERIRKLKLDTEIGTTKPDDCGHWKRSPGQCASACAFAFLGGLSREAFGGELGVHQFYDAISVATPSAKMFDSLDMSNQQFVSALLIDYVFRMGADPRLVSTASSTPPSQMNYLDEGSLDEMKVRWNPKQFEPWSIEPKGAGVIAITRTRDKTQVATFALFADGIPRLILRYNNTDEFDVDWLRSAMEVVETVVAFDLTFPKTTLKLQIIEGNAEFEFALNGVDGTIAANSKWAGIGVTGPRFITEALSYEMPRQNVETTFQIALKNSI